MKKRLILIIIPAIVSFQTGVAQQPPTVESYPGEQKDKIINNDVIQQRGKTVAAYRQAAEVAQKEDILIGVTKFEIGKRAQKQPANYGGSYKWDFFKENLNQKEAAILENYIDSFNQAWRRLPAGLNQKVKIKAVVFVKNLTFAGVTVGGGFGVEEMILFINVISPFPGKDYVEHIFFHEYFHVLQNRFYSMIDYNQWKNLNPPGVSYYAGGAMQMIADHKGDPHYFFRERQTQGFVNNYAASDQYHDVTETFCYLMIPAFYNKLESWSKSDKVLAAKKEYLTNALINFYGGFQKVFY